MNGDSFGGHVGRMSLRIFSRSTVWNFTRRKGLGSYVSLNREEPKRAPMPTIKTTFIVLSSISVIAGIATTLAITKSRGAAAEEAAAYDSRYRSYLLADELRQSSDDLTRLGRTYVVTGDRSYKKQYLDVLSIRNGEKPRPQAYNRIYWDFVDGGNLKPRPDGETVPLLTLMKRYGFTDSEFKQLEEAQKNSDGLVGLEVEAMNL